MATPNHYSTVCKKAMQAKVAHNLTDTQTLLYNLICKGEFKLRNGDGQSYFDPKHNGFGYGSDRKWALNQLKP